MASILVDTGVWYRICDPRDQTVSQDRIDEIYDFISKHSIAFLWPIAYETLRTKFVRNKAALMRFEKELKSPRIKMICDHNYRDDAFDLAINSSLRRGRPLSMTDCALRLFLGDPNTRIKHLVTFNPGDFADVCTNRRIQLVT